MRIVTSCLLCLLLIAGQAFAEEKQMELATDIQKLSYALGIDIGSYFKGMGQELDLAAVSQGMTDSYNGNKPLLTPEETAAIQQQFAQQQQEKQVKEAVEIVSKNNKAAEDFLKENGAKEGVITTASGLQYMFLTSAEGPMPKADDTVKVHYRGTLLDGTEFDSSYTRGEPVTFPLNQVIPGWTEAVQLMNVGSKIKAFLPPSLAYGDRGAPPVIEPGSMLIFEIELLGIETAPAN